MRSYSTFDPVKHKTRRVQLLKSVTHFQLNVNESSYVRRLRQFNFTHKSKRYPGALIVGKP